MIYKYHYDNMQKLMKRAGCSLQDIREAYNSYYEGIPGQQKRKAPQVVPEEDESEDETSRSQSMFDRSDDSNNASTRASYKGRGKVTSGRGIYRLPVSAL
eukprot:3851402-Amphidinium_carterae.1